MVARRRPRPQWNVNLMVADMALKTWNAQHVARRSRLSPKTVNRFFDGSVQTNKTAGKIAKALGHSVERYFSHVEAVA